MSESLEREGILGFSTHRTRFLEWTVHNGAIRTVGIWADTAQCVSRCFFHDFEKPQLMSVYKDEYQVRKTKPVTGRNVSILSTVTSQ